MLMNCALKNGYHDKFYVIYNLLPLNGKKKKRFSGVLTIFKVFVGGSDMDLG